MNCINCLKLRSIINNANILNHYMYLLPSAEVKTKVITENCILISVDKFICQPFTRCITVQLRLFN